MNHVETQNENYQNLKNKFYSQDGAPCSGNWEGLVGELHVLGPAVLPWLRRYETNVLELLKYLKIQMEFI